MTYAMKAFDTPEGRLELEFDFIPTLEHLGEFVEHTCDTCIWDHYEDCTKRKPGGSCNRWRMGWLGKEKELECYKALHKKHYG